MARSRISTGVVAPQDAMISSMVAAGIVRGTVENLRRTAGGTACSRKGAQSPWLTVKRKNVRNTVTVMRIEERERSGS